MIAESYPSAPAERTRWILERRGPRARLDEEVPHAFFSEQERTDESVVAPVSVILLTNRECPWKCLMCDLWRNTVSKPVAPGAIARQIAHALARLPAATTLKLYNSGSFFDPGAIARNEWPAIAALARPFSRVVVECHPRLVTAQVLEFAALLPGTLEIAMGLETSDRLSLEKLNKRFTLADYQRAAAFLGRNQVRVRTFLLVHPPFIPAETRAAAIERSMRCAFEAGSQVVALIPTRRGNGALESLPPHEFQEPTLRDLETAQVAGLRLELGRVLADTWDLGRFATCPACRTARIGRMQAMNLSQRVLPEVSCVTCSNQ